jgi:hypothetical protein
MTGLPIGSLSPWTHRDVRGPFAPSRLADPRREGPRDALIALKCRQAYKDWVVSLARKHRTTPSQIIDNALVKFAEADGFPAPPER